MRNTAALARVIAGSVVCDRYDLLARCLESLAAQTVRPAKVIVVDNTPQSRRQPLASHDGMVEAVTSDTNLGGAGGYALAIMKALAHGADVVLMIDDDGELLDTDYIERGLRRLNEQPCELLAPLPIDVTNHQRLACAVRTAKGQRSYAVADVEPGATYENEAWLFNGALIPRATFLRFGLPDLRLFLRYDDVDFELRIRRGGGRVVTDTSLRVLHPAIDRETHPVVGGYLWALDPVDPRKRHLTFRNRGYVFWRHGMYGALALDLVRYFLHFVVWRRGGVSAYRDWLGLTWQGIRERLGHP